MNRIYCFLTLLLLSFDAFPQSWESIKDSEEYLYGEGWGTTVAEADKQALAALISNIASNVTSESHSRLRVSNNNGELDEKSQFTHSVSTYSQATLTNTQRVILKNEPDAYVARWIKKSEIDKIFESRRRKALDLVESAVRAEEKGKVDDVLRNYYWSLSLLKSLQYPNDVTYVDRDGKSHILTNWIKEQMDETFENIAVSVVKHEGDDVRLNFAYKGKPVNSLDYTYFDGQTWSNLYSAKDGLGVLELAQGYIGEQIQLKYEYEFLGEAQIDKEIKSVLNVVKGTSMRDAYVNVRLERKQIAEVKRTESPTLKKMTDSFTTNDVSTLSPPQSMGSEASVYAKVVERLVNVIRSRNYHLAKDMFTETGWDMFTKLIRYGKAKVLDSSGMRFYKDNGIVMERGLRMSFSFTSNIRKAFVEDIVLQFNKEKKIFNISFGLGKTAEDDILNKGVWDEKARFAIVDFLENYKTAYALKRLNYIRSVFDDNAVIITGTIAKIASPVINTENQSRISTEGNNIIKYNRQTKDQYLQNLKRCFERNEFVNIRFANNDVTKLGKGGELYAIQIAQDYYSSTYGDKGYLMLMVDINNPQKPLIILRTWQPEKDPNFGLYGPGNF